MLTELSSTTSLTGPKMSTESSSDLVPREAKVAAVAAKERRTETLLLPIPQLSPILGTGEIQDLFTPSRTRVDAVPVGPSLLELPWRVSGISPLAPW